MYCRQQNYSLLTLRQQLDHFCKQTYEQRLRLNQKYNATHTNMTNVPAKDLAAMSEKFFYVQSLRDRVTNISQTYKKSMIADIFQGQTKIDNQVQSMYIVGLIFGVISLILGLFLVNYMKKLYFKEIIIVSFLNNEMISKNKRV